MSDYPIPPEAIEAADKAMVGRRIRGKERLETLECGLRAAFDELGMEIIRYACKDRDGHTADLKERWESRWMPVEESEP